MSHGAEIYSVGNTVNNYVIALDRQVTARLIMVIILKCIQILNHCVVCHLN